MTPPSEDELNYRVAPLDADAQARLIEAALSAPQAPSLRNWFDRALTDWRYALPYKAAAMAGVVAAGFVIGVALPAPATDIGAIALPDTTALEAQL